MKTQKRTKLFKKYFYKMLSNIEPYQSEMVVSALLLKILLCVTHQAVCLQMDIFILTSSCHVCLHSHKMLWLY